MIHFNQQYQDVSIAILGYKRGPDAPIEIEDSDEEVFDPAIMPASHQEASREVARAKWDDEVSQSIPQIS